MSNIRFGDFTWLADLFSPSPQQQDHAELVAMHKRASELYEASPFTNLDIMGQFHFDTTEAVLKASEVRLTQDQIEDVFLAVKAFSDMEPTLFAPPPRYPTCQP